MESTILKHQVDVMDFLTNEVKETFSSGENEKPEDTREECPACYKWISPEDMSDHDCKMAL